VIFLVSRPRFCESIALISEFSEIKEHGQIGGNYLLQQDVFMFRTSCFGLF